ncbi:helix-turn-helix domain-containing protein [Nitrospinae bacterium AH_259_B05_G02_I21]|nr:helix-turn-helix domain-containing protein [Nitrospinae bacterium AH_259_B05_G02_I21]MDA2931713.1 helix-turn-helix domain-containing protein [Nitrospinae bacterium AH-259-F20]
MNKQLLSTAEAANFLRLSPATLRTWRCRGAGPEYLKIEGTVRYDQDMLRAWLRRRVRKPKAQSAAGCS